MKYFFYLCALALALGGIFSCAGPRAAQRPSRAEGTPYTPDMLTQRPDSIVVKPHRSLVDKVLGRKPDIARTNGATKSELPARIGKKSTVSVYYGPATVTTNTAGKKAAAGDGATTLTKPDGPTATAPGAVAQDFTKQGQRGGAAASGTGATATATTQKGGLPWWAYVLIAAGGAYGCYRLYKRFITV